MIAVFLEPRALPGSLQTLSKYYIDEWVDRQMDGQIATSLCLAPVCTKHYMQHFYSHYHF